MEDTSSSPRVHSLVEGEAVERLRLEVWSIVGRLEETCSLSPRIIDDLRLYTIVSTHIKSAGIYPHMAHVLFRFDMP